MSRELTPFSEALTTSENYLAPENLYETVDFRSVFIQQQSRADSILERVSDVLSGGVWGEKLIKSREKETR